MVSPKQIPHGTTVGYSRGCRCPECKTAIAEYYRLRRNNGVWTPPQAERPLLGHGTLACYERGCRCEECKEAKTAYGRAYKRRARAERKAFLADTAPIETTKYRDLVEKALGAFSLDPDYVVRMCQAAASAKP